MQISDAVASGGFVSCAVFMFTTLKYYANKVRVLQDVEIPKMRAEHTETVKDLLTLKAALKIYETCPYVECPWKKSEHSEELKRMARLSTDKDLTVFPFRAKHSP